MLLARSDRLHNTSGGASDTELNELAVSPNNVPSARRVVMTVTPVANCDKAFLKCAASKSLDGVRGVRMYIVEVESDQ